jgi:hypothetical protein
LISRRPASNILARSSQPAPKLFARAHDRVPVRGARKDHVHPEGKNILMRARLIFCTISPLAPC